MTDQTIATRLKLFMDSEGLTNSQFADMCGIPRPSLSQLLSGRNKKISDVLVKLIHTQFPDLSVLWLMFGEGEMLMPRVASGSAGVSDDLCTDSDDYDSAIFAYGSPDEAVRGKEMPLSAGEKRAKVIDAQYETELKELASIKDELEKLRKNPRKVTQITVYYDDSTFETFVPKQ